MSKSVVIIGSGPAGVSAARPLIEAGLKVTVIDAGFNPGPQLPQERPSLAELRAGHPDAWRYLIGEDLRGMRLMPSVSPKLRLAPNPENFAGFAPGNAITTDNFVPVGTLAQGGLSNVWGAVTFAYDRADMTGWPIGEADLAGSFRKVSARVGISGPEHDPLDRGTPPLALQEPLPLSPLETRIVARYRPSAGEFRLGRTRVAVLTADRADRKACTLDNACMLGCAQRAIYSSAYEVPELACAPNVAFDYGFVVDRLQRNGESWRVIGHDRRSGAPRSLVADKAILATGALASARLGLHAAGVNAATARLENSPDYAFQVLFPGALGAALPERSFGLARLGFTLPLSRDNPADELLGLLYPADANSATEFLARMPVTRLGGFALLREMIPALMVAFVFFPGRYSANRMRLGEDGNGVPQLAIHGGRVDGFNALARSTMRRLRRLFLSLGGIALPGGLQIFQPGADVHYAGPLAMGEISDRLGEIKGAPGLHCVDGAALPTMLARNPTLTIMANADRIGTALAEAWKA